MRAAPLAPMKPVAAARLPRDDGWRFEVKWDGMRAIITCDSTGTRLWSSRGNDVTERFPEFARLHLDYADRLPLVLDGEIVSLDPVTGIPSFGRLQPRIHRTRPHPPIGDPHEDIAVHLVVFDLLEVDGHSTVSRPYVERRRLLESLPPTSRVVLGPSLPSGERLLTILTEKGMEGVVAKRVDSPYTPGRRTGTWLKIKRRQHQEYVVGGWTDGSGNRNDTFGALLLGAWRGNEFHYAGKVGSGFDDAQLSEIHERLVRIEQRRTPFSPPLPKFERVHWVQPLVVVEVALAEATRSNRLRHPSFIGLRDDKDPRDVTFAP